MVLNHMREGANFTFGSTRAPGALRNLQARSLQCGGLVGLQNALDEGLDQQRVDDICMLIQRALRRYGSVQEFPLRDIVRGISSYGK